MEVIHLVCTFKKLCTLKKNVFFTVQQGDFVLPGWKADFVCLITVKQATAAAAACWQKNTRKQKFPLHVAKLHRSHYPVMTSRTPATHVTVTSDPSLVLGVLTAGRGSGTGQFTSRSSVTGTQVRTASSSRQQSLAAAWRIVHLDRLYLRTAEM